MMLLELMLMAAKVGLTAFGGGLRRSLSLATNWLRQEAGLHPKNSHKWLLFVRAFPVLSL